MFLDAKLNIRVQFTLVTEVFEPKSHQLLNVVENLFCLSIFSKGCAAGTDFILPNRGWGNGGNGFIGSCTM